MGKQLVNITKEKVKGYVCIPKYEHFKSLHETGIPNRHMITGKSRKWVEKIIGKEYHVVGIV